MSQVNDPVVVAQVLAVHHEYESALMANDVEVLGRMFWHSSDAVRFGVAESLYGIDEIERFRKARSTVDLFRTVSTLKIVTFGRDTAITTVEFKRLTGGVTRHGRQTQVWRRFDEGWRIVSAHVSFTLQPASVVDAAQALVGLSIPPEYRAGVEINVARAAAIAESLLELDLPETVEAAPVFQP